MLSLHLSILGPVEPLVQVLAQALVPALVPEELLGLVPEREVMGVKVAKAKAKGAEKAAIKAETVPLRQAQVLPHLLPVHPQLDLQLRQVLLVALEPELELVPEERVEIPPPASA